MARFNIDRDPEDLKDSIGQKIRDYHEYRWWPAFDATDEEKIAHLPSEADIEDLIYSINEMIDDDYTEE